MVDGSNQFVRVQGEQRSIVWPIVFLVVAGLILIYVLGLAQSIIMYYGDAGIASVNFGDVYFMEFFYLVLLSIVGLIISGTLGVVGFVKLKKRNDKYLGIVGLVSIILLAISLLFAGIMLSLRDVVFMNPLVFLIFGLVNLFAQRKKEKTVFFDISMKILIVLAVIIAIIAIMFILADAMFTGL